MWEASAWARTGAEQKRERDVVSKTRQRPATGGKALQAAGKKVSGYTAPTAKLGKLASEPARWEPAKMDGSGTMAQPRYMF